MGKLIIHRAEGNLEFEVSERTSIGRHPMNQIHIPDRLISKEHCLIFLDRKGNYVIRDLGSQNGTAVNNRRLGEDCILRDGDHITIGSTQCIFSEKPSEEHSSEIERDGTVLILSQTSSKMPSNRFMPEKEIRDEKILRADYEKLRVAHELHRDIGDALDLERIFERIIERTFELLNCDRAVILTPDDRGEMLIRASKTRNKTDRFIVSSTILKHVQDEKVGLITSDALSDERFAGAESVILQNIRSSMTVPILYENQMLGIMMIDSAAAVKAYTEKDLLLFGNIANQTAQFIKIAEMARQIEVEARTRERFQRLLSPALAEMVVSGKLKVEKGGQSRVATVLFADIRGFTALCEDMPAAEVLQMLNEFFELMVEAAFRYEGTVDKFVGDQIMVVWGAPVTHPDDAVRAARAAIEMQKAVDVYSDVRRSRGQAEIKIGIGINSGELVAGYIGSTQTMSYSVVGDEVNTASRLCSAAGAGDILVSENTFRNIGDRFEVLKLAPVKVKGKAKPVEIYQLVSEKRPGSSARMFANPAI
ncbi:MAG: adenylate/guanylate cyclase domain-containing protein [Syntrophobacteraceae bacterium]